MNPSYTLTRPSQLDLVAQDNRRWLRRVVAALHAEYTSADWWRPWGIPWVREAANVALYVLIVLAVLMLPIWA